MEEELIECIRRFVAGDPSRFEEIYNRTIRRVYRTAYFLSNRGTDVEDIVQDVYVELFKCLHKYDCSRPFYPWLSGVIVRQASAHKRKRWKMGRTVVKIGALVAESAGDFSVEVVNVVAAKELLVQIDKLTEKLRQVVILRYYNEHTQEEIADILGIPLGMVKSRINSALAMLRSAQSRSIHSKG